MAKSVGGVWPADKSCHINILQMDMMDGLFCVLFILRPTLCYKHVLVRKWPIERFSPWQLSFSWWVPILSSDVISRCGPSQDKCYVVSTLASWVPAHVDGALLPIVPLWFSLSQHDSPLLEVAALAESCFMRCPCHIWYAPCWWGSVGVVTALTKHMAGVTHLMMPSLWQ